MLDPVPEIVRWISVVVPTRDRPDLIADLLDSVLRGTRLPDEIVVADQSREGAPGLEERSRPGCSVRHLRLTSVGLSRACNTGIRACRGDVVVLTHDDVQVEPDWLARLVGALEAAPPRSVVAGLVVPGQPDDPNVVTPSVSPREDRERRGEPILRVVRGREWADPLFPQSFAAPREAFREVGLFDERLGPGTRFPAAEDNDLGRRLLDAGYSVVVCGDAVVTHRSWRSRAALVPLGWAYGLGQGAFFAKHLRPTPRYVLGRIGRELRWRVRRSARVLVAHPRQVAADVAYSTGMVVGLVCWAALHGLDALGAEPPLGDDRPVVVAASDPG